MKKIILFLLFTTLVGSLSAQHPINVTLSVRPPYPTRFEDYESLTDKIIVTLTNTTGTVYDYNINFNMDGPNGLNIHKSNALSTPKQLGAFESIQFIGSDWDNLTENLTENDITPASERDFLTTNRVFRSGSYTICIRITDFNNPSQFLSGSFPDGCYTYDVEYGMVPEIRIPTPNEELAVIDPPVVNISWDHMVMGAPFEYTVKVIDITDIPSLPATELMNNPGIPVVYEGSDIIGFSDILADEPFEEGHHYAVRVTAVDPNEEVYFNNSGHSQVIEFYYGSPSTDSSVCVDESLYDMEAHFPYDGDTIPFMEFPLTGKFSPHCDDFWRLDFTVSSSAGGPRTDRNTWPDGAFQYLKNSFNSNPASGVVVSLLTWEQAAMSPLMDIDPSALQRGQSYTWQASTEMSKRNGDSWMSNIPTTTFVVGMPRPKQVTPHHLDTIAPGTIPFNWITGGSQEHIIPDFKLSHIRRNGTVETRISDIHEHWVLQVYDSEGTDTANIVAIHDEPLDVYTDSLYNAASREFDENLLNSQLVKNLITSIEIDTVGEFWWRISWLKNPDLTNMDELSESDIYHSSTLRKFIIRNETAAGDSSATADSSGCVSTCTSPTITDRTPTTGLDEDQTLTIGNFTMKVVSITSESGTTFTGTGEIRVPFLNNIRVAVKFSNINKNAAGQIFSGTVVATQDREFSTNGFSGAFGQALGMSESEADELDSYLNSGARLLSMLDDSRAIGMPMGIDNEIDGNQFAIALTKMIFTPDSALLDAIVNVEIPSLNDAGFYPLSLGAGDVCFSPDGLGNSGKAFLPIDHQFDLGNDNEFKLSGMEGASSINEVSYVEWDCHGFKCINLSAEFLFSRDVIIPDSTGGLQGSGRVSARGLFKGCRGMNFMGMVTMDKFQIPSEAMSGYGFTVEEAWLDWSTFDNPEALISSLPENYDNSVLTGENERLQKTWKGFWLKQIRLDIPEYIGNVERRTAASVRNLIIDDQGFTASFRVENLLAYEQEGHIDGFAFSIDTLFVDVVQNSFRSAGLSGKFGVPIADEREYIKYRAALDHSDSLTFFNFVAQPQDSLTIPMSLARAAIAPTSYFNMTLGDTTFVELNLTGDFSISQGNNGGTDPGALNLNMPKVIIENFRFNSKEGFDDSDFAYSLASPQKSMSGFPISLESFSIGLGMNPTVTIQPRLTLMGKEGGFSAAAMVTLEAALVVESSGIERIRLNDIRLDRIDLDVKVSQVTLKGYLEFYKESSFEGIRGGLAVGLPAGLSAELNAEFGSYKVSESATFNTANWYNYWYVDGLVTFGETGVTVFAGLQLYGLGGGVYHHMARSSSLPVSAALLPAKNPSESATATSSDRPYTPDFTTDLGIKFGALFGAPGGGKTYNFDVLLEAAFSGSRGLTYFGFKGNLRAITDGLEDRDAPIMGYLSIEYHNPASGVSNVQGDIIISVNFLDILTGVGSISNDPGGPILPVPADYTGPRDNLFVQAQFYSNLNTEEDYWYFNMGSPDNRGGLKLGMGDDALLTFTTYLMVGHEVPSTLPPPSPEFMAIYNAARGDFSPSGGDVSNLIAGQVRETLPTGEGFAIGAAFSMSLSANPIPFYFEIAMAIGFDINMTWLEGRRCIETGKIPGKNNFYATGQFYAGIRGEFGLGINLWFIKGKFPIFEGAAALILSGGIPNPVWAQGEGAFSYRILGGMFKGSYHFLATIGEVCTIEYEVPPGLASINFIQDLKPRSGSNNSVFSTCSAAFSVPIGEILEIPRRDPALPPRFFEPFISTWTLKENNRTAVLCEAPELLEDNVSAVMLPVNSLREHTSFTQRIAVRVYEYLPGGRKVVFKLESTNSFWEEEKIASFRTGSAPSTIVDENVLYTYPFKNQRSFLKGETQSNFGYVRQRQGTTNLFPDYGSEFDEHTYKVRFIKMGEEDVSYETPLLVQDYTRLLKFDVSGLENDEYYSVQIVQVKNSTGGSVQSQALNSGNASMASYNVAINNYTVSEQSIQLLQGALGMSSDVIKKRSLPGPFVQNPNEKILYYYYFKTSSYNTFKQKVQNEDWDVDSYNTTWQSFTVSSEPEEKLEHLDGYGKVKYLRSFRFDVDPLVKLTIQVPEGEFSTGDSYPVNSYYQYKVQRYVKVPQLTLETTFRRHSIPFQRAINFSYSESVDFKRGSFFKPNISNAEIDRIVNPTVTTSRTRSSYSSNNYGQVSNVPGFARPTISSVIEEKVYIQHSMGFMGRMDLAMLKMTEARNMFRRLRIRNSMGMPITNSNPNHYTSVYWRAHPASSQSYITVGSFLSEFSPSVSYTLTGLINRQVSVMNYSYASTGGYKGGYRQRATPPHSFIMQYRYPSPTLQSSRKATMLNGSSYQVKFYNL